MGKVISLVFGAEIQTHKLSIKSLLSLPVDWGNFFEKLNCLRSHRILTLQEEVSFVCLTSCLTGLEDSIKRVNMLT